MSDELFLVMNTFSGRYLSEQNNMNIGHENINFFQPDNCNYWLLWFNPSGILNSEYHKYDGKITLLMISNIIGEPNKFRILAKAEQCHIIPGAMIPGQKITNKRKRYKAFSKDNRFKNAKYGKSYLTDIYKDNKYRKEDDDENTLATFYTEPEHVYVPKDPKSEKIIITVKKDSGDINQRMSESMRIYIKEHNISRFKEKIINNKEIGWSPVRPDNTLSHFPKNEDEYKVEDSFFSAIKSERDELVLSNLLAYSLINSPNLLEKFSKYLLNNPKDFKITKKANILPVKREDKNVDLTIALDNDVIVIENKIDSTIVDGGKTYEYDSFIKKIKKLYLNKYKPTKNDEKKAKAHLPKKESKNYDDLMYEKEKAEDKINLYEKVKKEVNKWTESIHKSDKLCQLTKYYIQSQIDRTIEAAENHRPIKKTHFFFLIPEYNKWKFRNNYDSKTMMMKGYKYAEQYKIVTYKQLYDHIFRKNEDYFEYKKDLLNEIKFLSREFDDAVMKRQIYLFLKKAKGI